MMIGQRNPFDASEPMRLDVPQVQMPQGAPQRPEHKLNWGAIIADALSGLAGQQGQYPQRVERERAEQSAFERGEQRYQRERNDGMADWRTKQEWEDAHRQPTGFGGELVEAGVARGTPEYTAKYNTYISNRLDPSVTVPIGDQLYVGPRSGLPAIGGGPMKANPKPPPPQVAIEELRRNPGMERQFDEVFGEGAAASAMGGSVPQAPSGFPYR